MPRFKAGPRVGDLAVANIRFIYRAIPPLVGMFALSVLPNDPIATWPILVSNSQRYDYYSALKQSELQQRCVRNMFISLAELKVLVTQKMCDADSIKLVVSRV